MSDVGLSEGTLLDGKWRIEGLLGLGGMGAVYAARHVRNGREVAVKLLHPAVAADKAARDRFLQEGYAANQVDHPGAVQVLDDGVAAEGVFLVMERLRGSSIEAIAERRGDKLDLPATLAILDAALEVVATAHRKGMVHRDLKPENLFLTEQGVLKVLDFGLARVRQSESGVKLTATGVPMGTPAFMPPEQALAHWDEVDASSDVFALGASAFTLLSGELIHPARTPPEMLVMASTRQVRSVRQLIPSVPPPIAAVIDRALAFDRRGRYPDAGAMRSALHEAMRACAFDLAPLASLRLLAPAGPDAVISVGRGSEVPSDAIRTVPAVTPTLQAASLESPPRPGSMPEWSASGANLAAMGKAPAHGGTPIGLGPTETVAPITSDRGKSRTSSIVVVVALAALGGVAAAVGIHQLGGGGADPAVTGAGALPSASAVVDASALGDRGPIVTAVPAPPSASSLASASASAPEASHVPSAKPSTAPPSPPPNVRPATRPQPSATVAPTAKPTSKPKPDPDDPLGQYKTGG